MSDTALLREGASYFFKTFAHYYLGRVTLITPTHVVLENASEVYETGPLASFFGAGVIKYVEILPDGWTVPLSGSAWGPWAHALPDAAIIPGPSR